MPIKFSDRKGPKDQPFRRRKGFKKLLKRLDLSIEKIVGSVKGPILPDLRFIGCQISQFRRQIRFIFGINGEKMLQLIRQKEDPGLSGDPRIRSPRRQDPTMFRDQKKSDGSMKGKRDAKSRSLKCLGTLDRRVDRIPIFPIFFCRKFKRLTQNIEKIFQSRGQRQKKRGRSF